MRVLLWHGWLLEGTGSNVHSAKVAEAWRRDGHEVVVLCQQRPSPRFRAVDAWGRVSGAGVSDLRASGAPPGRGSVTVIRPEIGRILPVFVWDEYEGFEARRFVDLSDEDLDRYLEANVEALRVSLAWRAPEAVVAGHLVPGPAVARRAGLEGYAAKVHGSDLEYAVRLQDRYAVLAAEGVVAARSVVGASRDVLARATAAVPAAEGRTRVVAPGVDVERWRPRPRSEALGEAAGRLDADPQPAEGRRVETETAVRAALAARDGAALDRLAASYDQAAPDAGVADGLRSLASFEGPLVGYLGKLIAQKGVERVLEAAALLPEVRVVVVGFGTFREWLSALVAALDRGDPQSHAWLADASPMRLELKTGEVKRARGLADRVTFTGRLDHRYVPEVVAALDALAVPSTLEEAFGMVAAEGAAAGAFPVVARHSSLAEVAEALEEAAGAPGAFSFEPGAGGTRRLAERLDHLIGLPPGERAEMREAVRSHVRVTWTWDRTASGLLEAATR